MKITQRAAKITPSLTLEITAKAKKMKEDGISVIGFGAGEPDFNTPEYIINAAKKALDEGKTKYTPASGIPELKKAICDKLLAENGLSYNPSQIIISSGAKNSLYNAIQAIVEDGDEVIIPAPFWLTYPELVSLSMGTCKYVYTKKENGYKMTAEELKNAIGPKTKLLIFNTPNNPTGAVYSEQEIREIAKVVEESGIYVISDEIYEKLVYDGEKHFSIAAVSEAVKNQTIIINGVSKTYSMTGWRIGYLACPENVAKAIGGMQSHTTSNPCTISQYATLAALSGGKDFLEEMVQTFDKRRKYMVETLKKIEGIECIEPKGAFYTFVNVKNCIGKSFRGQKINGSLDFANYALQKGIAVIPGGAFGADDCIRLSYAISMEDIKEGLKRFAEFISEVQ